MVDEDIIINFDFNTNNDTDFNITETYDNIFEKLKKEHNKGVNGFYHNLNKNILIWLSSVNDDYDLYKKVANKQQELRTGVTIYKPKLDAEGKIIKNTHKPKHYIKNGMSPIYAFTNGLMSNAETKGFLKGNVIKYLIRYQEKNGIEDLYKAREYLIILIAFEKYLENGDFSKPFKY